MLILVDSLGLTDFLNDRLRVLSAGIVVFHPDLTLQGCAKVVCCWALYTRITEKLRCNVLLPFVLLLLLLKLHERLLVASVSYLSFVHDLFHDFYVFASKGKLLETAIYVVNVLHSRSKFMLLLSKFREFDLPGKTIVVGLLIVYYWQTIAEPCIGKRRPLLRSQFWIFICC